MEFVQFFPIGHLAPRLVGMDPIMWDPFRYKLGGKLLNGQFEEFIDRYGSTDFGRYNATRDIAAYAILKEVEAGRGTPHGGAYLDFRHIPETQLRAAFGPVIDRLLANGIDLTKMAGGSRPDRALSHGRDSRRHEHADANRRALCRRRGGRRLQRRQSPVRQCDHRSVRVRRARRLQRR